MRPDPVQPPVLRVVDNAAPPPPVVAERPQVSLLGRMIEAAEPGDFEALLVGLIFGVLLIAVLVVAANLDAIAGWTHG